MAWIAAGAQAGLAQAGRAHAGTVQVGGSAPTAPGSVIGMNGATVVVVVVCVVVGLVLGWLASRVALGRAGVLRNAYGNITPAAPAAAPPGGWGPVDPHALPTGPAEPGTTTPTPAAPGASAHPTPQPTPGREGEAAESVQVAAPTPGPGDGGREEVLTVCLAMADRLRESDGALWKYLHQHLERAGVTPVFVDGQPFDAEQHDAVGFELTADTHRHLTVAVTERAGYRDRGRVVRRPEVVVYREGAEGDHR